MVKYSLCAPLIEAKILSLFTIFTVYVTAFFRSMWTQFTPAQTASHRPVALPVAEVAILHELFFTVSLILLSVNSAQVKSSLCSVDKPRAIVLKTAMLCDELQFAVFINAIQ